MSRRFSDDPVNLIDRIPTRAQLSAARPPQRAWARTILESGATCARGVAEAMAQVRRLWRLLFTASTEERPSGSSSFASAKAALSRSAEFLAQTKGRVVTGTRNARVRFVQAYDRLAEWIANLDAAVPPTASAKLQPTGMPGESASLMKLGTQIRPQFQELADLKTAFLSQQQELAHVSAQLQELKALVVSQQQVLMFLGRELDTNQASSVTTAASSSAKRARVVRAKPGPKLKKPPHKGASKPSLNF